MKAIAVSVAMLGAVLAGPAAAQSSEFIAANLLGQDVDGGKGDEEASANLNGEIDLRRNRLCYYLDMEGLSDANAAHLHQEGAAATDPPTLALTLPGPGGDEVCVSADKALLEAIAADPGKYYVDVHTPGHPDGAVRGKIK